MPAATIEKDAVCPAVTLALAGCAVIDGATAVEPETLRVPALLVALPALFVTTTLNCARLSEEEVGGVVYAEEFAPLIEFPFFNHW